MQPLIGSLLPIWPLFELGLLLFAYHPLEFSWLNGLPRLSDHMLHHPLGYVGVLIQDLPCHLSILTIRLGGLGLRLRLELDLWLLFQLAFQFALRFILQLYSLFNLLVWLIRFKSVDICPTFLVFQLACE